MKSISESIYSASARHYDGIYSAKALEDVPFYLELAAQTGGPVLELAAGTGRVTIPLARAGHEVTALDLNPAMLARLEAKLAEEPAEVRARVTLVQGDMADFMLARTFKLVLTPFRGFQHLLESAQQRACLGCVAEHLEDDGLFVLDIFNPNFEYMVRKAALAGTFTPDLEYAVAGGGMVRRFVSVLPDFAAQINTVDFRYDTSDAEGRLITSETDRIYMRWLTRWEAQYLLELSGLAVTEAYGAYDKRGMDAANVAELIFVCRRA